MRDVFMEKSKNILEAYTLISLIISQHKNVRYTFIKQKEKVQ